MRVISTLVVLLLSVAAFGKIQSEKIYDGTSIKEVGLDHVLSQVTPGTVVIVSEYHGMAPHHEHQVAVIQGLVKKGFVVNVGMEFFDYLSQPLLDEYLKGNIGEKRFLKKVRWGGIDYKHYRRQVLGPVESLGWTFGINAPRSLSSKLARGGLRGLNPDEQKLLPPSFDIGNDDYFERFKAVMGGGHVDPAKLERYFLAQSLWDDTAAWKIIEIMNQRQSEVMVVAFGDFHNTYGGGLPDRLRHRGYNNLLTISQVDLRDSNDSENLEQVAPSKKYGPRADFVWTAERPLSKKPKSKSKQLQILSFSTEAEVDEEPLEAITELGTVLTIRGLN